MSTMITKISDLRRRFEEASRVLGATKAIAPTCEDLLRRYADPQRVHHGVRYLEDGLARLDGLFLPTRDAAIAELAWWFHKAVLHGAPFGLDESLSASLAWDACTRMSIDYAVGDHIRKIVRATHRHVLTNVGLDDTDLAAAAVMDLDLADLGGDPLRFATYRRDLYAELGWLMKRVRFYTLAWTAKRYLARDTIYRLPAMRERYETRARENLTRLLAGIDFGQPRLRVGATDEHIFTTWFGMLHDQFTWDELVLVASRRDAKNRTSLVLSFSRDTIETAFVRLDDVHDRDVVDRLRALPDYERKLEADGRPQLLLTPAFGKPRSPIAMPTEQGVYR